MLIISGLVAPEMLVGIEAETMVAEEE